MRLFGKFILLTTFSTLFTSAVLLSFLQFQLLNQDYLFKLFDKYELYSKAPQVLVESLSNDPNLTPSERKEYQKAIQKVAPAELKKITKDILGDTLSYLNGKSDKIQINFSAKVLGIKGKDINISVLDIPGLSDQLKFLQSFSQSLFIQLVVVLFVMSVLLIGYGQLTIPKRWVGSMLLISNGAGLMFVSCVLALATWVLARSMPTTELEPSQALIKLLLPTVILDILKLWVLIGLLVLIIGIVAHFTTLISTQTKSTSKTKK